MTRTERRFLTRYLSLGLKGHGSPERAIEAFEQAIGLPLPAAYKAYLYRAGDLPDWFWIGSDCCLKHLPDLQEGAIELLAESGAQFQLPKNAVVFWMHQGYQFLYFIADGTSDDPPVYYYFEGKPAPELHSQSFSAMIESALSSK